MPQFESVFLFLQDTKQTIDEHIAKNIESHDCNEKSKQIEEKMYRLEQEKIALEHQLQNQAEVLAAARQNIQTQQTKLSYVEKSIIKQKRTTEKLLADLKVFESSRRGMLSRLRLKK